MYRIYLTNLSSSSSLSLSLPSSLSAPSSLLSAPLLFVFSLTSAPLPSLLEC